MRFYPIFLKRVFPPHWRLARYRRQWVAFLLSAAILLATLLSVTTMTLLTGLAFVHDNSDLVVNMVELVRDKLGPEPVALVENMVFQVEDWYNRLHYQVTGDSSSWQFTTSARPPARSKAPGGNQVQPVLTNSGGVGAAVSADHTPTVSPLPPIEPIVTSSVLPGEGQWHPLVTAGQLPDQPPILWSTVFRPDPDRPFALVGLVAMDLSRSRLHLMIGTLEPKSKNAQAARLGLIPLEVQTSGTLLAAWNGGFKTIHGHYGMMTEGIIWLPPKPGIATIAIDQAGHVVIGAWGRGVSANASTVAWRQNNPPLIENGVVNPDIHHIADTADWGPTVTKKAYTWRSGLGLTQDGRWLIYAAGNSLSTETLTLALQVAGAYNAMQTDINSYYDRFETYSAVPQRVWVNGHEITLPLTAQRLIDQMKGGPDQFLVPYKRDFFYLTTPSAPANTAVPHS